MVDFRRAEVDDPAWWRRCNVLIAAMDREDDRIMTQALLQFHCAYVANGSLLEESFKAQSEAAKQALLRLFDALRPWAAEADSAGALLQQITDKYRAVMGDPNDPAFIARIKDGIRRHEELQAAARASETEEQRVLRRVRERDAARAEAARRRQRGRR